MPTPLKLVAQQAMDRYYTTYVEDNNFFKLPDFIDYGGNALGDIFLQMWKEKYGESKQERKDEVVTFDNTFLSFQEIVVPPKLKNQTSFKLSLVQPIMAFPYDQNNCGCQTVLYRKSDEDDYEDKCIRTTLLQKFTMKQMPVTDRIFFYLDGLEIGIVNRRWMPIDSIKIYYVPSIHEDMLVPDGLVQKVIDVSILSLKESEKGVIVNRELGNNPNVVMQSEMDKSQLK